MEVLVTAIGFEKNEAELVLLLGNFAFVGEMNIVRRK